MKCDEADATLIEYLNGNLSPAIRQDVERHLEGCSSCKIILTEYKIVFAALKHNDIEHPGAGLKEKFNIMLQSEIDIYTTSNVVEDKQNISAVKKRQVWLRFAASILLVAGGVAIGMYFNSAKQSITSTQLASLNKEVEDIKEALMFNLLTDESASKRIEAVSYVENMNSADPKIINALINTLNTDKNVNVRLAALNSVEKFFNHPFVSDSLVMSLQKQAEPLMQIALINMFTEKKETKAIVPIEKILPNKNAIQPVKDMAAKSLRLIKS